MILVDSSVWIDFFNDRNSWQVGLLETFLDEDRELAVGDLILAEVLQGTRSSRAFSQALSLLSALEVIEIGGTEIAIRAAQHFRALRSLGITVRATIDTLIAARCIQDGLTLLHNDRDFAPFAKHLGLIEASAH